MIELQPTDYPSDIATLLLLRGAGVPPLRWDRSPIAVARGKLAELNDAALCARESLEDVRMGAAVRGLLYLLNGWVGDARHCAADAPAAEQAYILSLCDRHAGDFVAAKKHLQSIEAYPTFADLLDYATQVAGQRAEPAFKRFLGIMQMGESWEPFAFLDLYAQAEAGQFEFQATEAVARVQCVEFELLFARCFKQAVANRPAIRSQEEEEARKRVAARREQEARKRMLGKKPTACAAPSKPAGKKTPSDVARKEKKLTPPDEAQVRVRCPKCKEVGTFFSSFCGKMVQCKKCSAVFSVPYPQKPASAQ